MLLWLRLVWLFFQSHHNMHTGIATKPSLSLSLFLGSGFSWRRISVRWRLNYSCSAYLTNKHFLHCYHCNCTMVLFSVLTFTYGSNRHKHNPASVGVQCPSLGVCFLMCFVKKKNNCMNSLSLCFFPTCRRNHGCFSFHCREGQISAFSAWKKHWRNV